MKRASSWCCRSVSSRWRAAGCESGSGSGPELDHVEASREAQRRERDVRTFREHIARFGVDAQCPRLQHLEAQAELGDQGNLSDAVARGLKLVRLADDG